MNLEAFARLAIVDVETTGLSPAENRIAEIGVVTVDGDAVDRWTTLIKTSSRREWASSMVSERGGSDDAPSFGAIAAELARRLSGRLFVAHNARFDHAFLRAEFDRVGVSFNPEVLCSVMLSRKLYPHLAHHDLDSLIACHGLRAEARHRALPDADLVWQLWQIIHRQHSGEVIADTIKSLLAGPVLPPQLDPSLIERLPEAPGAYVFHGEGNRPLIVGAAGNLKLHVLNYFRIDRATDKALEYSHRITNITWRVTRGKLGAQLYAAVLDGEAFATGKRRMQTAAFTWQFSPEAIPSVEVVPLSECRFPTATESFGIFASERKARNALVRLATKHRLCHCLLGISGFAKVGCPACPVDRLSSACVDRISRKRQLVRVFAAVKPLEVPSWPHRGPVGIRERAELHVVDRWQYLGTARSENELHALLESSPRDFDRRLYLLLKRTLSRMPQRKIVDLSVYGPGLECSASVPADFHG
ncbi:MAG: exonuclease domain-containing protein [Pseudomonadota bacterium]|nr:exonuclease domain-containing protein [Pseudomonadota bacterium]